MAAEPRPARIVPRELLHLVVHNDDIEMECEKPLGSGSNSEVTAGKHNGVSVAVKTPYFLSDAWRVNSGMPRQQVDTAMRDLLNEVTILMAAQSPNVVKVLGIMVDVNNEPRSIILERCRPFDSVYHKPLDQLTWGLVVSHVLSGLDAIERAGSVHRDLKPANLLVDENGTVKIADLSEGKIGNTATQRRGTPIYMAPEIWQDSNALPTPAADRFSAAVMFIELATGREPVPTAAIELGLVVPESVRRAVDLAKMREVMPGTAVWIEQCLCNDPNSRPSIFKLRSWLVNDGVMWKDLVEALHGPGENDLHRRALYLLENLVTLSSTVVENRVSMLRAALDASILLHLDDGRYVSLWDQSHKRLQQRVSNYADSAPRRRLLNRLLPEMDGANKENVQWIVAACVQEAGANIWKEEGGSQLCAILTAISRDKKMARLLRRRDHPLLNIAAENLSTTLVHATLTVARALAFIHQMCDLTDDAAHPLFKILQRSAANTSVECTEVPASGLTALLNIAQAGVQTNDEIDAIMFGMQQHVESASIQASGCLSLWGTATTDRMTRLGCSIEVIITAMTNHRLSAEVQLAGCLALARLGSTCRNRAIIRTLGGDIRARVASYTHDIPEVKAAVRELRTSMRHIRFFQHDFTIGQLRAESAASRAERAFERDVRLQHGTAECRASFTRPKITTLNVVS